MWLLLMVVSAWAAVFTGPEQIKIGGEDILVAWKNTSGAAVTVTALRVDDAATLQVVPPKLPKTVEPGKSFKFLVVAEGTLAPGYVTAETSAGQARLWVAVARAYIPALGGGAQSPGKPTAAATVAGPVGAVPTTIGVAETLAPGGPNSGFGGPDSKMQILGPLDPAVSERVLKGQADAIRRCAGAAPSALVAVVDVEPSGVVRDAEVMGTDTPDCLEAVFRAMTFPAPGGPSLIRWEFTLAE